MQILSLLIQISSSFIQNSSFFINNSSIIVDTNFIIFDNKFIIFTPASTGAPHGWRLKDSSFSMHNSSFFNAKLIVLNAEFIVFNTKFIICSTKFIIFNTKLTYQRAKHMHALRYVPGIKSCRRLLVFLLSRKDTFHTASRPSRHGMFSASCKNQHFRYKIEYLFSTMSKQFDRKSRSLPARSRRAGRCLVLHRGSSPPLWQSTSNLSDRPNMLCTIFRR